MEVSQLEMARKSWRKNLCQRKLMLKMLKDATLNCHSMYSHLSRAKGREGTRT